MIMRMIVLIGAMAFGLGGCLQMRTKERLYTEKDRVQEPAIEGTWQVQGNEGYETLEVKLEDAGTYKMRMIPGENTKWAGVWPRSVRGVVLIKVGRHFLIETPDWATKLQPEKPGMAPLVYKVALIEGRLFVGMGLDETLQALMKKNADAVKHRFAANGEGPGWLELQDSTEKSRAFVEKYAADLFEVEAEQFSRADTTPGKVMETKEQTSFEVMWLLWTQTRLMCRSRDLLSRIVPEGLTAEKEADWRQRYQQELLPKLELKNCDEEVAKLYKDVRAALASVYQRGQKDETIFADAKDGQAGVKGKEDEIRRDPVGSIGRWLPEGDADRKTLESLGKRVGEVGAKWGVGN